MALNLGTLVANLTVNNQGLQQGLQTAKKNIGDFVDAAGKAMAVGGAAAGALLAAGVVKAMDLQAANAKLAGQLGLSAETAARYGAIAGKVYSDNWGENIDEVNEAIKSITQNIGEGNDQWLQDTTETVLAMSSTFGVGADEISRSVAQMLNTGMATDTADALDLLTKGFQNGNDRAGDLLDTMTEYGTQFRKLGIEGPAAMGLISQGLQGGARDSDLVADAIKEFSIRAVDGSKNTAQGFEDIGLSAQTMAEAIGAGGTSASQALDLTLDRLRAIPDPVARAQAAALLFGTQAEDLGNALFDLDPSTATQALGEFSGAAATMAETVGNTASGNIESFKRQVVTTFVTFLGGKVLPIVTQVTAWFSSNFGPAVDRVTAFLRQHKDAVQAVGIVLGVVAGAIAAVVVVTQAWAVVQGILNAVMTANPVGIVVVAIAALIAIIVLAYNKIEWFRNLVNGVFTVLKAGWDVFAAGFAAAWHGVVEPVWAALSAAARDVWQNVLQPAFAWIGAKWDELSAKLQLLWATRIQPALSAFGAAMQELWANYGQKLSDWWNAHWPAMSAAIQAAWTNFIQPALSAFFSILGAIVDYVQAHWPEISATIQSAASIIGSAFSALGTVISTVWAIVSDIWNAMKAVWSAVSGAISGGANAVSSAFSAIGSAATTAYNTVKSAWTSAVAFFTGIKDSIVSALSGAGSWLIDTGRNIINGLLSGIRGAVSSLAGTVSSLVKDAIPGPIRSVLGINSPSRVMAEQVGQWIPKGIAMGIDQHADVVAASMRNLVDVPTVSVPTVAPGGAALARGGDGAMAAGFGGADIVTELRALRRDVLHVADRADAKVEKEASIVTQTMARGVRNPFASGGR